MPETSAPTVVLPPLFKWTGGKRREIVHFAPHYPAFVDDGEPYKYVEPFVGGGAVYWALANPNSVINDWDSEVINFYRVMASQDEKFIEAVAAVEKCFGPDSDYDSREQAYYELRNLDRDGGLAQVPAWRRAARFFVVNQLAFSGMRRFNGAGEFNVPFGHYKNFNGAATRSQEHADLLATTTITQGDYATVLAENDTPRTFIYLDPPYTRVMKTYSAEATFGDEEQLKLRNDLVALENAHWMVVIDKSDLTMDLYGDYVVHEYDVKYGVNIKNRFDQGAKHIVACNYETPAGGRPKFMGND